MEAAAGIEAAEPGSRRSGLVWPAILMACIGLHLFFVLRPALPAERYLPHELALIAATLLTVHGHRKRMPWITALGAISLLLVLFTGWVFIPITLTDCEGWVAGGRLRIGAF